MRRLLCAWLWLGGALAAGPALAQEGDEPPPNTADNPAGDDTTEPGEPPPSSNRCVPECRDGFLCHRGTCVEACNPPCGPGERCTSLGECLPDAPRAAPADAPPADQDPAPPVREAPPRSPPPPPGTLPVPQGQLEQAPPEGAWRPDFSRQRGPMGYGFRPYGGIQVAGGGSGTLTLRPGERDEDHVSFDFDPGGGFEGGFEFKINRFFGIGPGLRLFQTPVAGGPGDILVVEVLAVPTFHIPAGRIVDVLIPIPVGLGVAHIDGSDIEDGGGLTLGITPGAVIWFTSHIGMYAQIGFTGHAFMHDTSGSEERRVSFIRGVFNVGVTFGF